MFLLPDPRRACSEKPDQREIAVTFIMYRNAALCFNLSRFFFFFSLPECRAHAQYVHNIFDKHYIIYYIVSAVTIGRHEKRPNRFVFVS